VEPTKTLSIPDTNTNKGKNLMSDNNYSSTDINNKSTDEVEDHLQGLLNQTYMVDIFASPRGGKDKSEDPKRGDNTWLRLQLRTAINKAGCNGGHVWWRIFETVFSGSYATATGQTRFILELNEWTDDLLYKGEPTTEYQLIDRLENALGILMKLTSEQFNRKFAVFIGNRSFNPVKRLIEDSYQAGRTIWDKDEFGYNTRRFSLVDYQPLAEWGNLAEVLFGVKDSLSNLMLQKWLVAAIARAMTPGCQADNVLVLRGRTGTGKSTFFRMVGGDYFKDLDNATEHTEVKRMLNSGWVAEMGEMEGITSKKDVEELKAFITKLKDNYRGLYAKSPKDHPRHVVFGGTCNSSEILRDSTGNRRFWIIDTGDNKINRAWLEANRADLLATAYHYFLNGFE
jgi:Virulence-associated protein E